MILFMMSLNLFSQKFDGVCLTTSKMGLEIENIAFSIYKDNTFINEKYTDLKQVNNSTPEELLKSQFSVKDNKWLSINYNKTMDWTQKQFDDLKDPNSRIELLCKLSMKINNIEYSILKINTYDSSSTVSFGSILMQKNGNKWFITENKFFSNIEFVILFMSVDDLYYIFNNKPLSSNSYIKDLIKNIWVNKKIQLNMAINELGVYY